MSFLDGNPTSFVNFPTLQIVVEGPTIPDKGGRGNPEVFAR